MSFDTIELSRFLGRPVRLFVFTRQSTVWRFCTGDRDITIGENTYYHAQIDRSEIRQTVERAKDSITIKLAYLRDPDADEYPVTQSFGDNWFPYVPSSTVTVVCMEHHYGDTDPPVVQWMGQVTQPKFTDTELELVCEPTGGTDRARNQGAKWQRSCWKTVYSTGIRGCNLDPSGFEVAATLSGVSGLTLTASAFGTAPINLAGGSLVWTNGAGMVERRSIMAHSGSSITVLYGSADLAPALNVVALPTCPRTWAACEVRGNTINFGGAIYKPVKKDPTKDSMSWG